MTELYFNASPETLQLVDDRTAALKRGRFEEAKRLTRRISRRAKNDRDDHILSMVDKKPGPRYALAWS